MPRLPAGQPLLWQQRFQERLPALRLRKPRGISLLADWVVLFLDHLLTIGYQPRTVGDYYYFLRRFTDWCVGSGVPLVRRIQRPHVVSFLHHRLSVDGVSRRAIRFQRHKLRVFFSFLLERDVLKRINPAAGIGFYGDDSPPPRRVLSLEECRRLIEAPLQWDGGRRGVPAAHCRIRAHRDAAILALMLGSGLRRSEVAGLTIESLSFEQQILRVHGKGRQRLFRVERDVFVHPDALREIRLYLALTGYRRAGPLFLCLDGGPLHPATLASIPPRYGALALGRHVTAHELRHAFATHLIQRGADPHTAQRLLGHKDVATTLHYYLHLTQDEVRQQWRATCPVRGSRP